MYDIDKLTPRQLVAGLMRGNAANFQLGYGPEAATHAAQRRFDLDSVEFDRLLAYAQGWADGAVEHPEPMNLAHRESEAAF